MFDDDKSWSDYIAQGREDAEEAQRRREIAEKEKHAVYCRMCMCWVEKSDLKRWTGDDALHYLCPGCDSDLVPVQKLEE
jgi:hypothetical protein